MKIKSFLMGLFFVSAGFSFSDMQDTGSIDEKFLKMQNRLDSLEVIVHKLTIGKNDNTPGATGEIRNWGQGLYGAFYFDVNVTNLEIGKMFINNNKRVGASIGILSSNIITRFNLPEQDGVTLFPLAIHIGFEYGTPVFLNFVSIVGYANVSKQVFNTKGEWNDFLSGKTLGLSIGGDMEFWLTKQFGLSFGPVVDLITPDMLDSDYGTVDVNLSKMRFGLKYFF